MDFVKKMGISYNETATELDEMFALLKADAKRVRGEEFKVPEFTPQLINIVKDTMKDLKIDTKLLTQNTIVNQLEVCDKAKEIILGILNNWEFDNQHDQVQTIRLRLAKLASSLHEFIRGYKVFLLLAMEDRSNKLEKQYVDLLKDFSQIFNLKPEDGEGRKISWEICGKYRTSMPAIRYSKVLMRPATYVITCIMNGEVKRGARIQSFVNDRMKTFNINAELPDNHLAQHAGELLMEAPRSYFTGVIRGCSDYIAFGMICVKTKIIFIYLKMTDTHFAKIQDKDEDESVEDENVKILYTRPYDFMDTEDHEDIMESLFWLGFQQDEHKVLWGFQ